ncbi:MAG: hypothetical protein FWF09_00565 [Bacteroidales bacterium]|nr:hypothetical protein [Bacteroidales bacterium]
MLYLVLTALLALNVSAEILNAFKIVDASIVETNRNFERKINETYAAFSRAAAEDPAKNAEWFDRAKQVKEWTDALVEHLDDVRGEVILRTEGKNPYYFVNGEINRDSLRKVTSSHLRALDKNDAPVRYFMGDNNNGEAKKLRGLFETFREQVVSVLKPEDQASLLQKIGLQTEGPERDGKFKSKMKDRLVGWEEYYFGETILAADIVILNNFIQEARNAEYDVISKLQSYVGAMDFKFNAIDAKIIPNSKSVSVGEKYHAYVSVVAYDTMSVPEVYYKLGVKEWSTSMESTASRSQSAGGISFIDIPVGSVGEQFIAGVIKVKQPDGTTKDYTFSDVFYGQAKGGGSIVNDELKVLYMGYDNSISVTIPGSRQETISCRVASGSASSPARDNSIVGRAVFKINPTKLEDITIVAEGSDGGRAESTFKVKELPAPLVSLGGSTNLKRLSKSAILSAGRLEASLGKDFLLSGEKFKYTIIEFTLQYPRPGGGISQETFQGGSFTQKVQEFINTMPTNTTLSFIDIKVKGPDGRIKESQNSLSCIVN